jgi:hypothetical protein
MKWLPLCFSLFLFSLSMLERRRYILVEQRHSCMYVEANCTAGDYPLLVDWHGTTYMCTRMLWTSLTCTSLAKLQSSAVGPKKGSEPLVSTFVPWGFNEAERRLEHCIW